MHILGQKQRLLPRAAKRKNTNVTAASFVIAGASGTVGRQIVPALLAAGARLMLVGRDPQRLRELFPHCDCTDYAGLAQASRGFDTLVFLATINNDQVASEELFHSVNVDLALATRKQAQLAGIRQFIYFSSTHALDDANDSEYARSKRMAVTALRQDAGINTQVIYLPAVVGEETSGRLGGLNALPRPLASPALSALQSLKATVHISLIVEALLGLSSGELKAEDPLIVSNGQRNNAVFAFVKRSLDLACAVVIVVLLGWAMVIVWIAVQLQSPGPGIFAQTRVGREGREFTCYKFRTMYVSAPNVATHEAPAASVTSLGAFLRRTKLDELPQVFNIFANQMSLVGPRPCLPSQTTLIAERHARGVLTIKPGITGLAQVNDIDMSDPVHLARWDQRYLKLQSLLLDLKLIIQTGLGKGRSDKIRKTAG